MTTRTSMTDNEYKAVFAWREIETIAATADKLMDSPVTKDMAPQLIPKVQAILDQLNELAKIVALSAEESN